MDVLCRLFGKSRQAYYKRSDYIATKSIEEDIILSLVREVRKDFPRMGSHKLLIYLKLRFEALNMRIGRDIFIDLLYCNFILVRRVRGKKTTFSNHWMHKYPNLIVNYTPVSPNRLWVSDITYVDTDYGSTVYLSLVTDAYSHKIVSWNLSRTLRSYNALAAFKMALKGFSGSHPELMGFSILLQGLCQSINGS
jgi:hypothetical protein